MDNRKIFEIITASSLIETRISYEISDLNDIRPRPSKFHNLIPFISKAAQTEVVLDYLKGNNRMKFDKETHSFGICPREFAKKITEDVKKANYSDDTCFVITNDPNNLKNEFLTFVFEKLFPGRVFSDIFTGITISKMWSMGTDYDRRMLMGINVYNAGVSEGDLLELDKYKNIVIVEDGAIARIVSGAVKCNLDNKLPSKNYSSFIAVQCGNPFK